MYRRSDLLVEVAILYYEEDVTQTEISKRLGISRPTVARLLQEAKDKGVVKIAIQHTEHNVLQKQESLEQKYNLKTVLIASKNNGNVKSAVGSRCASFIENRLSNIKSLGIGWGTTVFEFVQQTNYFSFENLTVIPLIGGVGISDVSYHSNHLAFTLAQKYNCEVKYFYAPAISESLEMKKTFEASKLVGSILTEGRNVDMAIVGVGNPIVSSTYRQFGYINEKELKEIEESNAIGDIAATFFDKNGDPVHDSVSERILGINIYDLMNIPNVIALATGREKVESIKTLIKKKVIDHLIIDNDIANELL